MSRPFCLARGFITLDWNGATSCVRFACISKTKTSLSARGGIETRAAVSGIWVHTGYRLRADFAHLNHAAILVYLIANRRSLNKHHQVIALTEASN